MEQLLPSMYQNTLCQGLEGLTLRHKQFGLSLMLLNGVNAIILFTNGYQVTTIEVLTKLW